MKTAVEWLIQQLDGYEYDCEIFNKAKQMEKEQIQNSFENGVEHGYNCYHSNEWGREPATPNFEQYYNETYKNTNETF